MALLASPRNEVVPEYQKSILSWKGTNNGKQFTPIPPKVTTVKVVTTLHRKKPSYPPPSTSTHSRVLREVKMPMMSHTQPPPPLSSSSSTSSTLSALAAPSDADALPPIKNERPGPTPGYASMPSDASQFLLSPLPASPSPSSAFSPNVRDGHVHSDHTKAMVRPPTERDASPTPSPHGASSSQQDERARDTCQALLALAAGSTTTTVPAPASPVTPETPPKRARDTSSGDVHKDDEEENATLKPSSPKRVKTLKASSQSPCLSASVAPTSTSRARSCSRATSVSPTVSAVTSRASSPTPSGRSSGSKKSVSRTAGGETYAPAKKHRRKKRLTDISLPPKKGNYQAAAPVMVRSVSMTRPTTAFGSDTNAPAGSAAKADQKPLCPRKCHSEEDGAVRYYLRTSEEIVKKSCTLGRYVTYFRNPNDPNDTAYDIKEYPTVDLEYPNSYARESFLLLRPKDEDHYDPTMDIQDTLCTFIKDIVPPEYKGIFGPLPEDALNNIVDRDDDDDDMETPEFTSTSSSRFASSTCTPQTPASSTAVESDCPSPPPPTSSARCSPAPLAKGLMKTLASARHWKDGHVYTATLREINRCLRELKHHPSGVNLLAQVPHAWSTGKEDIPQGVVVRIIEETYQRCVGPKINQLRKYEAFSSNVYGELTPAFINDIIARTRLRPDSIFLDLGSGVGNVVLQVALQTGCFAYGIEERQDAAEIAREQLEQIRLRCRMWGVSMGEVELEQGDMTTSRRVDELMGKADVVLVNNYVFTEELNASLRPKFLDLKEGALVISLKPFAQPSSHQKMLTERNFDDISAIFDVNRYPYREGTVSWSGGSGAYFVHRVNREGYRESREAFENLRRGGRRGGLRR